MTLYRATVRFQGFDVGEIVDIPFEHDVPKAIFDNGYLVPVVEQEPKNTKQKEDIKIQKVVSTDPSILA